MIVDRLTQSAHFLLIQIVRLHEVSVPTISDRDNGITSRLSQSLQRTMGTQLDMSVSYHLQTNSQGKRTIQPLEVMLSVWVFEINKSGDTLFPLTTSSYNNNYCTSIKIAPFETLYSHKCWSLASILMRPETICETTEKIIQIKAWLQASRDRQKSYSEKRRKPLGCQVGDRVLSNESPWKGMIRFRKREN